MASVMRPSNRRGVTLRAANAADLPKLALYDRSLTGMERPAILAHLALRQPARAWIAQDAAGKMVASCWAARAGWRHRSSRGLPTARLCPGLDRQGSGVGPGSVHHRCTGGAPRCAGMLGRQGAATPRGYMRMTLGEAKGSRRSCHVFALAGPNWVNGPSSRFRPWRAMTELVMREHGA